jgi:hypothetical protein
MYTIWKQISRRLILWSLFFLPKQKKIALERWLRGKEEYRKLRLADAVIVSFGKSGRTWLRVMLSRFYQVKHGLATRSFLGFDNFHRKNPAIPKLFFTHDNYLKDYTGHADSKVDYYDRKVVLLARDPRDVAVSQFFQWQHRMRPGKKDLNKYPAHGSEIEMFDFVMDGDAGLPKIIAYMNGWANEAARLPNLLIVRYEDMRTQPEAILQRIVEFIGTPGTAEEIQEAVAFASYDNMKKLEEKKVFWLSGSRLVPRDRNNPDSFKVRRAKVGGYRDYFNDQQVAAVEALVHDTLSPAYGYGTAPAPLPATRTAEAATG